MKIPKTLKTPKYYVAISESKAFSSWNKCVHAEAAAGRIALLAPRDWRQINGIIKVDQTGRKWIWRRL